MIDHPFFVYLNKNCILCPSKTLLTLLLADIAPFWHLAKKF
jgi:hypothetical protein